MSAPSLDTIRQYSLFGGLPDTTLAYLIHRLREESAETGQILAQEGSKGDSMWCIARGAVRILRKQGTVVRELARLGAGETVGEMELIDMLPRSASIEVAEPSLLYRLGLQDLLALQREHLPSFTIMVMNLARDLSRRLRRMDGLWEGAELRNL